MDNAHIRLPDILLDKIPVSVHHYYSSRYYMQRSLAKSVGLILVVTILLLYKTKDTFCKFVFMKMMLRLSWLVFLKNNSNGAWWSSGQLRFGQMGHWYDVQCKWHEDTFSLHVYTYCVHFWKNATFVCKAATQFLPQLRRKGKLKGIGKTPWPKQHATNCDNTNAVSTEKSLGPA